MDKRQYKATFIINLRATTRSIEAITEWLKGILAELGAQVVGSQDIGVKDFARVTSKKDPQGHFIAIDFKASGDLNSALQQKLRLEQEIKRTFVELQTSAVESKA